MFDNPEIKRYLPVIYAVVSAIILFLVISWIISPKFNTYKLYKTPFRDGSFATLQGDGLYAYSGNAFYRVNPKDSKDITILSKGLRLPTVKQLYWAGNEGALLAFDDAQTDGSAVETELAKRGQFIDEVTLNYVWYLDFKTNTLSLVSTEPLGAETAYYSAAKHEVYFIAPESEAAGTEHDDDSLPLWSYNTKTLARREITNAVDMTHVSYIGACSTGDVCVIQDKDPDQQVLWTIKNGKKEVLYTYDAISSTNNPAIFVGEKKQAIDPKAKEDQEDEELKTELLLLNLGTKQVKSTGLMVNFGTDIAVGIYDNDKKLSVLNSALAQNNASTYQTVAPDLFGNLKAKQVPYKLEGSRDKLAENITHRLNTTPEGVSLVAGSEGGVYLMSKGSYKLNLERYDGNKLSSTLKPCFDKYTKYHQYAAELSTVTVGVVFDDNFQKRISDFSGCIERTDKLALIGQNYIFLGVSPDDGRLVTN